MITENDKKIIEIVKDFMPKDLVFGCIVKDWNVYWVNTYYIDNKFVHYFFEDWSEVIYPTNNTAHKDIEILWTLDTTVILKYMRDKVKNTQMPISWDCRFLLNLTDFQLVESECFWIIEQNEDNFWQVEFLREYTFECKPYNLLSEEEKGNMIEILIKIKNDKTI